MSRRIHPALVVAVLALVAAAVGTALAGPRGPSAQTSASSKRIALKALRQAKKAKRAARNALKVAKVARGGAARAQTAAIQAQASADNAQTAAGQAQGAADQAQARAVQAQASAEQATLGRSAYNLSCDPSSPIVFLDCVGTTLTLPRPGRVLLNAAGGQASGGVPTHGLCRLEVDDSTAAIPNPAALRPGEVALDNTDGNSQDGFAVTTVTDTIPAGLHKFEMSCTEESGDQAILNSMISAVMIGSG